MTPDDWIAVRLSIWVAACSRGDRLTVGDCRWLFGLARWQSTARWVLETVVNLPLVLPPVVEG